jgi:hypothetical protein
MEKLPSIQNKAISQNQSCIACVVSGDRSLCFPSMNHQGSTAPMNGLRDEMSIFLIQNKGKGPPGRLCSPERGYSLDPDYKSAVRNDKKIKNQKKHQNIQYQFSNFYHQQIFIHN